MSDKIEGTEDQLRAALYALLDPSDVGHAQRAQDTAWRLLHRERDELLAEVERLRVRSRRLRAALEKIASAEPNVDSSWHVQIARQALARHKE